MVMGDCYISIKEESESKGNIGDKIDNNGHEWELVLEEYKSLREEELNKMDKQYQIIGLGTGGIGALLSLAIEFKVYSLFLLLPLMIISMMSLYHFERMSILNIGGYVKNLEDEYIKTGVQRDKGTLGWEKWLEKNIEKRRIYIIIEMFSTISLFLIFLLSIYVITISPPTEKGLELITSTQSRDIIALIYLLFGCFIFLCCNSKNFKEISEQIKYIYKKHKNISPWGNVSGEEHRSKSN